MRTDKRTYRIISGILCAVLLLTMMHQATMMASAQITESFESGFGDWTPGMNNDPAFFDVSISSLYAYEGTFSVKLQSHGLPPPDMMTAWIERTVQAPPNTWLTMGLTFQLLGEGPLGAPQEVLAYVGNNDPQDYPDFVVVGEISQLGIWTEYTHIDTFLSGPTGQIYAAIGYYNSWNPSSPMRSCYVDLVNLTGVSDDYTPPVISNLRPGNQTTISNNKPAIGADYSDDHGIDTTSVVLEVDGADVTAQATITVSNVTYMPAAPLLQGVHNVYLEVKDDTANHNTATATWWFIVDSLAPTISNLQPANESATGNTLPTVGASYSDASGIDTGSVVLMVDSMDVTAQASVTVSDITYAPALPLADSVHNVSLEVKDQSNPQNTAVRTWWFFVDTQPPVVSNLQPANGSFTSDTTPFIGASYSDLSGIDTSSVMLYLDAIDVTASATVTASDVTYVPAAPLTEGTHDILLSVGDNLAPQNTAFEGWFFTVDTQPPVITNMQPPNLSIVSEVTPTVGASYSDASGIDTSSVFFQVDGIDVTPSAALTPTDVSYVPTFPLWDGVHTAYLEVKDNSSPQNTATVSWSFTVDSTLPLIFNMQPANQSATGDSTPDIGAMYSDDSGIDVSIVLLEVDGVDVTTQATVGPNMITHTPTIALSEGTHNVYLEVGDQAVPANTAVETWWFVVDTQPPVISNLQPVNESTLGQSTPTIGASYTDLSGIDTASVVLMVDAGDVTHLATITSSDITYIPSMQLSDGVHNIYLEVSDSSSPQNTAVRTWWFTIAIQPPVITNLQPANQSTIGDTTPVISASYSDDTGIDVGSVVLTVDAVDVTTQATVTQSGVLYVPSTPLSDGTHTVFLSVADTDMRVATETWSFTIDSIPPTTSLTIAGPNYTDGLEKVYVSSSTLFSLTAEDAAGIEAIWYLYHASGEPEPAYSLYMSEFSISSSKPDGIIYIKYKSMDDFGNEELPNIQEVRLDNTPPVTSISIGNPSHVDSGITYITSTTSVTFFKDDFGSAVSETWYRIFKDGVVEVDWTLHSTGSVFLSGDDGPREIRVKSIDVLGNEEDEVVEVVNLDNSPPSSSIIMGTPSFGDSGTMYVTSSTAISFSAEDGAGSGVASTWYAIFMGVTQEVGWTQLTFGSISLSGADGQREIRFKSLDNLGNEEVEVVEAVYLDETPPTSLVSGYDPVNVTYVNSSLATVMITAMDDASGIGSIGYGIDDPNCPNIYAGPLLAGTMAEGEHRIYFKGVDNVGNEEAIQFVTIFLDTTPPTADAGEDVQIRRGDMVVLDGSGSTDGRGGSGIASYTWTFTYRGSTHKLVGATPEFVFEDRDVYLIRLTVEDQAGNTGTDTITITFASQEVAGEFPWWVLMLLIIVIVLLLALLLMRRKKEEELTEEENK